MQRKPGNVSPDDLPPGLPHVVLKYLQLSTPSDQIKSDRVKHLPSIKGELRQALLKMQQEDAIKVTSKLDGLITILLLIEAINGLRSYYLTSLQDKYGADVSGLIKQFELQFESHLDRVIAEKRQFSDVDINVVVQMVLNTCWSKATKKSTPTPTDEFTQIVKNLVFTIAASRVYNETDELQMLNISQVVASKLKSFFKSDPNSIVAKLDKLTPEKIKQPYQALAYGFGLVEMTPATAERWREVSYCLIGLYNRIYRTVNKKYKSDQRDDGEVQQLADGTYPTVDDSDEMFKKYKKVTKCEMSFYNRELGFKIQERMYPLLSNASAAAAAASSPLSSASQISSVDAASSPVTIPSSSLAQATVAVTWDQRHNEKHITISMPTSEFDNIKDQLLNAIVRKLNPSKFENHVSDHLSIRPPYLIDDSEKLAAKLFRLSPYLKQYPLTSTRELMLTFAIEVILARFDAYRHGGTVVHSFKGRTNTDLLDELLTNLDSASTMADKINHLIELRDKLIARQSVDLLGRLNEGLSDIYDILALHFPCIPEIQAEQRVIEHKGMTTLDLKIPTKDCDKDRLDGLEEAIKVVLLQASPSKLSGDVLPHLLSQMNHARNSEKVIILGACLRVVKLSEYQCATLGRLPESVNACVQSYCSTLNYGFFQKTHVPAALDFMQVITDSGLSKDKQLSRLLDFRNALMGKESATLMVSLDKLLVSVFDVLQINEHQLSARAAAR